MINHFHLYVDGAARNNPGPAGAGLYLTKNEEVVAAHGHYLGKKTNNQAEYLALVLGLLYARKHMQPDDQLTIFADSQLLVRQITGVYQVRNAELKPLHQLILQLVHGYNVHIFHILREKNKKADALANEGIDKKQLVPEPFKKWLATHDIII